jgi:hypothetical protein
LIVGSKFWRGTRKVKAIRKSDYSAFRGKRKKPLNYFSDSDLSDFELPCPISPKKIDLTKTPDDDVIHVNSNNAPPALQDVVFRLEKCVERSGDIDQLRSQLSTTQNEKEKAEEEAKTASHALEDVKECLSCIICKSVAPFPWIITPCCKILTCRECSNRWLQMEASCPHCRATVEPSSCIEVPEIRQMQGMITTLRLPSD